MNKEEAYLNIIAQKNWIDRAISKCECLRSEATSIIHSLEGAKDRLSSTEEYLKKFQPKKEMEKDATGGKETNKD